MRNKFLPQTRFSLQDQALFARRLSLLVRAGVPILESLKLLKSQSRKKSHERVMEFLIQDVANGQYLSKSMLRHKNVFGAFSINIIKIGETSGTLSENLTYLAEELDKKRELRRKLLASLLYPFVILIASFGVAGMLAIYLFPKLMPIFTSLRVDLPFTTRALLWTSNFLIHYGIFVIFGLILAGVGIFFLLKNPKVLLLVDRAVLRIPVLGGLLKNYHLSNMTRTLGLLLRGYGTVLESVRVTAETSSNMLYRQEIHNLTRTIARGGNLASHLEKQPHVFPKLMAQMVAIGEKTGSLSETLMFLSEMYEKDFEERNKQFSTVLEPLLMLTMGFLVGFVAISIITPIYEVTQHIHP